MLNETLRSRWFSACLHVGLWVLLLLAVTSIGGRTTHFREAEDNHAAVNTPVPVAKLGNLFAPSAWPKNVVDPASLNPFATTHFMPPIVAVIPPTTRRIEVTYQGYYQAADGPRHAMLRVGESLVGVRVGGMVVTNLFVADAAFQTVTLTNSAMQTNVLALNLKKEVEVPLK